MSRDVYLLAICLSTGVALEPLTLVKPGNVSRTADLPELALRHFVTSSLAFPLVLKECIEDSIKNTYRIGYRIRQLVEYATCLHRRNTCLGTAILLVPLAYAAYYASSASELCRLASSVVRERSTVEDSVEFYRAVRHVLPSYVARENPIPDLPSVLDPDYERKLREGNVTLWLLVEKCSALDVVCRQVVTGYVDVLRLLNYFRAYLQEYRQLDIAVMLTYLRALCELEDTVVIRKHGTDTMSYIKKRAQEVLQEFLARQDLSVIFNFDCELRARGVNPGSTADLIACMLSVATVEDFVYQQAPSFFI